MSKRRTPEELIALREEQNRKARLRLARARDPRIEVLEDAVRLIERCREYVKFSDSSAGVTQSEILQVRDALVAEAVKP